MLWGEGTARGGGGLEQRGQSCGPEGPYSAGAEPGSAVAAILMCSEEPCPSPGNSIWVQSGAGRSGLVLLGH